MAEANVQDTAIVSESTGGPAVDVGGHFKELRYAFIPALAFGIIVGLLVFAVRFFWPATYEVAATAKISSNSPIPAIDIAAKAVAAPFESLATDRELLEAVRLESGLDSMDDVANAVQVAANAAPGLLDVSARYEDVATAKLLVESMVKNLDSLSVSRSKTGSGSADPDDIEIQIAQIDAEIKRSASTADPEDLAKLYERRDALEQTAGPQQKAAPSRLTSFAFKYDWDEPVSPKPAGEAGVAALIAFILAAEGIVLANGRLGRRVTPSWARRIGRSVGVEVDSGIADGTGFPVATEIIHKRMLDQGKTVLVLSEDIPLLDGAALGDSSDRARGAAWAAAQAKEGESSLGAMVSKGAGKEVRFNLLEAWWQEVSVSEISLAIVVSEEDKTDKNDILEALENLGLAEVPGRLVVREVTVLTGLFSWLKI